jgi:hypothetical protein
MKLPCSLVYNYNYMYKLLGLHDTVGSVRPRRDTQRLCSTLSHIIMYGQAPNAINASIYLPHGYRMGKDVT